MKASVQWYVVADGPAGLDRAIGILDSAGLPLGHHDTGRITYLSEEEGFEGEQIDTTREELVRLDRPFVFQFWFDDITDIVCCVEDVPKWDCTLLLFDFDGVARDEGFDVVRVLFEAQQAAGGATVMWLSERVGIEREYGSAHEWDGTQRPGYPPERPSG